MELKAKGQSTPENESGAAEDRAQAQPPVEGKQPDEAYPFARYVPAPSLEGGLAWINTGAPDHAVDLRELRGKFVVLDFWTYCCINCMHVLPELAKLEAQYPNNLVVIGVHSAKFEGEKLSKNIQEAVLRYEIKHPVVNDAQHRIWDNYSVNSWPSFRVIDPLGNLVAGQSGELTAEVLSRFLDAHLPYYKERGLLDERPLHFNLESAKAHATPLRFPGKVLADEASQRLFIADSNHNRIVVTDLSGKLLQTIGAGGIGNNDGECSQARFNHPQGMALDGDVLYVADTENHLIRAVHLTENQVHTLAGTGEQNRQGWPSGAEGKFMGPRLTTPLNSPWDLWVHDQTLWIAMAGPHQIWKMPLQGDSIGLHAGNGREDIVDGRLLPAEPYEEGYASFAQPSGLSSNGQELFVADSEGSSIRSVPFSDDGEVSTIVGTAQYSYGRLFMFGDQDGPFEQAVLQHALGVAWHDDILYVADTYNDKIKKLDLKAKTVTALASGGSEEDADGLKPLDEPAGLSVASGTIYIADTNNHRIRTLPLAGGSLATLEIAGLQPPGDDAPPEDLFADPLIAFADGGTLQFAKEATGKYMLPVELQLPADFKLNPLAPMRYQIKFTNPVESLTLKSANVMTVESPALTLALPVEVEGAGSAELQVALEYYYCREGSEGVCKTGTVVWKAPFQIGDLQAALSPLRFEVKN